MDHNNPSPSKNPIQLSLYDITTLKGKFLGQKIELDKVGLTRYFINNYYKINFIFFIHYNF